MLPQQQRHLAPTGNCWQTAVACILDLDQDVLPPQHEFELSANRARAYEIYQGWGGSYHNVLQGYLNVHHRLEYVELPAWQAISLSDIWRPSAHPGAGFSKEPWMLLIGPTERTELLRKDSANYHADHCVVGRDFQQVWDPHPSNAGLLDVTRIGFLLPVPDSIIEDRHVRMEMNDAKGEGFRRVFSCLCPAHNLEWARQQWAKPPSTTLP